MPIDTSVHQYCEAQDIPLEYLDEYEKQKISGQFEWRNLFPVLILFLALPFIVILVSGYLLITFSNRFS